MPAAAPVPTAAPNKEGTPPSDESVKIRQEQTDDIFDTPGEESFEDLSGELRKEAEPKKDATPVVKKEITPPTKEVVGKKEATPEPVQPDLSETLVTALKTAFPDFGKPAEQLKQDAPQLTQEQINEKLKVYMPAADLVARLTSDKPEDQATALAELRDGVVTQAVTMAYHLFQNHLSQLRGEFEPIARTAQESSQNQLRTAFNEAYASLSDPKYQPVLELVTQKLKEEGFKPKDTVDAFKTIAERAESLLKIANPEFSLESVSSETNPPAKNGTNKPKTNMPKLPVTSSGGGGGSGGAPAAKETGNRVSGVEVFD